MGELTAGSRIVETSPEGDIIEITFCGVHDWTHGQEMNRYVESRLSDYRPAAILFNLLDYNYVFGNDVTVLFTASINRDAKRIRPICIVAAGATHTSLYQFFTSARILDTFRIEFASSVESGLQCLRQRIAENSA